VAIGIPATEFRFFFLLHTPSRRNYGFPPETAYAGTRQAESWFLLYPAEKPCFFDKKIALRYILIENKSIFY